MAPTGAFWTAIIEWVPGPRSPIGSADLARPEANLIVVVLIALHSLESMADVVNRDLRRELEPVDLGGNLGVQWVTMLGAEGEHSVGFHGVEQSSGGVVGVERAGVRARLM